MLSSTIIVGGKWRQSLMYQRNCLYY